MKSYLGKLLSVILFSFVACTTAQAATVYATTDPDVMWVAGESTWRETSSQWYSVKGSLGGFYFRNDPTAIAIAQSGLLPWGYLIQYSGETYLFEAVPEHGDTTVSTVGAMTGDWEFNYTLDGTIPQNPKCVFLLGHSPTSHTIQLWAPFGPNNWDPIPAQ